MQTATSKAAEPASKTADRRTAETKLAAPEPVGADWGRLATRIQTKLTVGASNDPEEKEAGAVQREAGGSSVPGNLALRIRNLGGGGASLDSTTRSYFEPRFERDFSKVRIHTGGEAAATARALSAHAYTHGSDIVFAAGRFSPQTTAGRRLMAHELAHVVQHQGRHRPLVRRWEACTPAPECPPRDAAERRRARRDAFRLEPLRRPQVGVLIAGFARGSADTAAMAVLPTFRRIAALIDGSSRSWSVLGFSDCTGSEAGNRGLRLQRGRAVAAHLPRSRTEGRLTVAAAPLADCPDSDATEEGRKNNRAVALVVQERPQEASPGPSCPPATGVAVTSLTDYLSLVRCAEQRTGFGSREMLRILRGLYFGRPWSVTATNPRFQQVIPCSGEAQDPRPVLGSELYQALQSSNVVEGVEMGHVFAGLETMTCPREAVSLAWTPGMTIGRVAMDNETFATWGGDVGAAAAVAAACWDLSPTQRMASGFCRVGVPMALPFYFRYHAESEDLEGDIDPFVLRARERGLSCGPRARRQPLRLSRPISEILGEYYLSGGGPPGRSRGDRYRCFVETIGGRLASGSGQIANRDELQRLHGPAIESFARTYYLHVVTQAGGGPSSILTSPARTLPLPLSQIRIARFAAEALELFFNWLDRRLREP